MAIETTVVPWIDLSAQENVDFSLRKLDKRQGWRGPVARLAGAAADELRRRVAARYGDDPPVEGRLYLGLVEAVLPDGGRPRSRRHQHLRDPRRNDVGGPLQHPRLDQRQAPGVGGRPAPGRRRDLGEERPPVEASPVRRLVVRRQERGAVAPGLRRDAPGDDDTAIEAAVESLLEQTPRVQGTIFSYDHGTGYVVSMVGGLDYDRSEFNRVTQACRQPGSVYKPMYYSLAIDKGYGFASLFNDVPRAEVDPITGEVWTPTNLNNTVEYQVTLEYALIWSKNVPSVQLFKLLGGREVEAGRAGSASPRRSSPTRRWPSARRARASTS